MGYYDQDLLWKMHKYKRTKLCIIHDRRENMFTNCEFLWDLSNKNTTVFKKAWGYYTKMERREKYKPRWGYNLVEGKCPSEE